MDECVERGFLRRAGDRLAFTHDLVRRAIEDSIPAGKARRLHARVLDALGAEGDLARRAHHAEGAGDGDKVVVVAPAAADEAARLGAHREAAAQYDRALRFGASLTVADRADLLERFAYELYITDQIEPAIEARQRALAEWTVLGDGLRCGDNLRWLSRLSWFVPRGEDARRYAAQAIEVLETHPPGRELAWAYSNQAQLCMLALDVEGARRWAPWAIELGETLGDIEVVAHALNNLGTAALIVDDETGVELLENSLALALGAGPRGARRSGVREPGLGVGDAPALRRRRAHPRSGDRLLRRARSRHLGSLHGRLAGPDPAGARSVGRRRRGGGGGDRRCQQSAGPVRCPRRAGSHPCSTR